MSEFVKSMLVISELAHRADVAGTPRISITFDTLHDRERFKIELERDLGQMVRFTYQPNLGLSDMVCAGVHVRVL